MSVTTAPAPRVADVPAGLQAAIHRCLAKDPGARFASVHALAEALAPFRVGGRGAGGCTGRSHRGDVARDDGERHAARARSGAPPRAARGGWWRWPRSRSWASRGSWGVDGDAQVHLGVGAAHRIQRGRRTAGRGSGAAAGGALERSAGRGPGADRPPSLADAQCATAGPRRGRCDRCGHSSTAALSAAPAAGPRPHSHQPPTTPIRSVSTQASSSATGSDPWPRALTRDLRREALSRGASASSTSASEAPSATPDERDPQLPARRRPARPHAQALRALARSSNAEQRERGPHARSRPAPPASSTTPPQPLPVEARLPVVLGSARARMHLAQPPLRRPSARRHKSLRRLPSPRSTGRRSVLPSHARSTAASRSCAWIAPARRW